MVIDFFYILPPTCFFPSDLIAAAAAAAVVLVKVDDICRWHHGVRFRSQCKATSNI